MSNFNMQLERLKKNFEIILPAKGLEEKLAWSKKIGVPLRVKLGFDPTAPDLHLGHFVALKKIREFQDLGHIIVIIIGDFTASIGDPTGRNKTRPPLSQNQINLNAQTYLDQLSKVIDVSKTEIHYNSKWLNRVQLTDLISLVSKITLSQILQREDFSNRYSGNIPIYFHELLYPIIQGYDSLMVEADVEIGGTDQLFNCLVGRDIQNAFEKKQQVVACVPILRGIDGSQKMSKSINNYIGLTEEPHNIYGKVMSIPDSLIQEYVDLVCDFHEEKKENLLESLKQESTNPMEVKKELAFHIVEKLYNSVLAETSAKHFYLHVQSRDEKLIDFEPIYLNHLGLNLNTLTLILLCSSIQKDRSKSELRRLIQSGGVTLNSQKITDPNTLIDCISKGDFTLKIGKRQYFKILITG